MSSVLRSTHKHTQKNRNRADRQSSNVSVFLKRGLLVHLLICITIGSQTPLQLCSTVLESNCRFIDVLNVQILRKDARSLRRNDGGQEF